MPWLDLQRDVLEAFADAARSAPDRALAARSALRAKARLREQENERLLVEISRRLRRARAARVREMLAAIPAPAVYRASCVACRGEVEIREGCRAPTPHPPCYSPPPPRRRPSSAR